MRCKVAKAKVRGYSLLTSSSLVQEELGHKAPCPTAQRTKDTSQSLSDISYRIFLNFSLSFLLQIINVLNK